MAENNGEQTELDSIKFVPKIGLKHYDVIDKLGSGGYAEVYKVLHRSTGALMAMKLLAVEHKKGSEVAERELWNIYKVKRHPSIVPWYDMQLTRDKLYQAVIMELCEMDLTEFITSRKNRDWSICLDVSKQVSAGVLFLHTHDPQIIHRDIKPQNILIKHCPITNRVLAKLSDFGISNLVELGVVLENATTEELAQAFRNMKTTAGGRGTKPFMAPEFFATRSANAKGKFRVDASVDIFALGLTFNYVFCYNTSHYVMLLRSCLSDGLGVDMYDASESGDVMPRALEPDELESEANDIAELINKMTSYAPGDRPSAQHVHELLCKISAESGTINDVTPRIEDGPATCNDESIVASSTTVTSSATNDLDLTLQLLQALNNDDQEETEDVIARDDVKQWVDTKVLCSTLQNAHGELDDGLEFTTCLTFACQFSRASTVQQLVNAGASVDVMDSLGNVPLHRACQSKTDAREKVKVLVQSNPSLVNAANFFNNTPIMLASSCGNHGVISALIRCGADVNEEGKFGRTALHYASVEGHFNCVRELVAGKASIDVRDGESQSTPLHLAAQFNHCDCVKSLIHDHGASINVIDKDSDTALHRAAFHGNADVITALTSHKTCDVNKKGEYGRTALHVASAEGHVSCISVLIKQGADVNATDAFCGATPLHLAVAFEQQESVQALLAHSDVDLNANDWNGFTALLLAASCGFLDITKTLATHKRCDVNASNRAFDTALHLFARQGIADMVAIISSNKTCDIDTQDDYGNTALHRASESGHVRCVRALLQNGADVNAESIHSGDTPLHLAASQGHNDCVKVLIDEFGASVNAKNKKHSTALHRAAYKGHADVLQTLLSYPHCKVKLKNDQNMTAAEVIKGEGHQHLMTSLTALRPDFANWHSRRDDDVMEQTVVVPIDEEFGCELENVVELVRTRSRSGSRSSDALEAEERKRNQRGVRRRRGWRQRFCCTS